jgi:hypothetical protein
MPDVHPRGGRLDTTETPVNSQYDGICLCRAVLHPVAAWIMFAHARTADPRHSLACHRCQAPPTGWRPRPRRGVPSSQTSVADQQSLSTSSAQSHHLDRLVLGLTTLFLSPGRLESGPHHRRVDRYLEVLLRSSMNLIPAICPWLQLSHIAQFEAASSAPALWKKLLAFEPISTLKVSTEYLNKGATDRTDTLHRALEVLVHPLDRQRCCLIARLSVDVVVGDAGN